MWEHTKHTSQMVEEKKARAPCVEQTETNDKKLNLSENKFVSSTLCSPPRPNSLLWPDADVAPETQPLKLNTDSKAHGHKAHTCNSQTLHPSKKLQSLHFLTPQTFSASVC